MKRFLLFAGFNYYPSGGWDDFEQSYDSLDEAIAEGKLRVGSTVRGYRRDWWHVVDLETHERFE